MAGEPRRGGGGRMPEWMDVIKGPGLGDLSDASGLRNTQEFLDSSLMPGADLRFGPMSQALVGVQKVAGSTPAPEGLGLGNHRCPQTFQASVNETRTPFQSIFHSFTHSFTTVKYLLSSYYVLRIALSTLRAIFFGERMVG